MYDKYVNNRLVPPAERLVRVVAHRGTQANKKARMLTVKSASNSINVSVKNPRLSLSDL